jgi:hypothetical protein
MTQRKREGPITLKSLDRNEVVRLSNASRHYQLAFRRASSILVGSYCQKWSYDRVVKVIDSKAALDICRLSSFGRA